MGDFYDSFVLFLDENYVYVIGVGLIIILMLIGFLASRKKTKKQPTNTGEQMANINDVNTGSINDVASNLQNDSTQLANVEPFPATIDPVAQQPVTPTVSEPVISEPTSPSVSSFPEPAPSPATPTVTPEVTPVVAPTPNDEVNVVTPPAEDKFQKTEVIDFSSLASVNPTPTAPTTSEEPKVDVVPPFVVDKSQYNGTNNETDLLNGETSTINPEEPKN